MPINKKNNTAISPPTKTFLIEMTPLSKKYKVQVTHGINIYILDPIPSNIIENSTNEETK